MSIRYTAFYIPSAAFTQGVTFSNQDISVNTPAFTIGLGDVVVFSSEDVNVETPIFTISSVLYLPETGFFLF